MRPATTPRWPLVLSIVGVIAAIAVIAVALVPLFDEDDDTDVVQTATTPVSITSGDSATTSAPPAPTTSAPALATSAATSTTTGEVTTSTAAMSSTSTPTSTSTSISNSTSTSTSTPTGAGGTIAPSTTAAVDFPAPVRISLVEATCTAPDSTDSRGNPITFNPLLTIDGRDDTAWRCPGASIRQALVYSLAEPADVTAVAALPGYAGEDPFNGIDRFDQNRRVTRARWGCLSESGADVASVEQVFDDRRSMQGITPAGFTDCAKIVFEILESSAPGNRDYAAVSEVGIYGPG